MKTLIICLIFISFITQAKPVRVGIAGMTHAHVGQVFGCIGKQEDVEIVGFAEPNKVLAMRLLKEHNLPETLWFATLDELIPKQNQRLFVLSIQFMSI